MRRRLVAGFTAVLFRPQAAAFCLALLGVSGFVRPASAGFIVNISQQGGNVVAVGSGTINLAALTDCCSSNPPADITSDLGRIALGAAGSIGEAWSGGSFSGPASFGSGGLFLASSSTGDHVEMAGSNSFLAVPTGYISGTALSDSDTWDSRTLSGLGLTVGIYTWKWGSGASSDSFVINVLASATSVPEPITLSIFGAGLAGAAATRRRKAKRA